MNRFVGSIALAAWMGISAAAIAADAATENGAEAKQRAEELVEKAKSSLESASILAGDDSKEAREKHYAAAVEAYGKALEIYPDWLLDDVQDKEPYGQFLGALKPRGDLWKQMRQFDKARDEYRRGFAITPASMLDLRSYIQMVIGDSYSDEENWIAAEEAYLEAQAIGLYGDRQTEVPAKIEKVKPLAAEQRAKAGQNP